MKGPGMRINLIAVCNCKGVSTTESYVINNLVEVILKVEAVKNIDFKISMMANKCASAENDAITINIICKQLRYSKKLNYSDFVSIWIDIGETDGRWLQKLGHPVYLLSLEFIITVNTITKPAFLKLYEDKEWTDFTLSTAQLMAKWLCIKLAWLHIVQSSEQCSLVHGRRPRKTMLKLRTTHYRPFKI